MVEATLIEKRQRLRKRLMYYGAGLILITVLLIILLPRI